MNTTVEKTACRFHTSLNVSDLARSVQFYRTLLGMEPAKLKNDYAKFEVDDPPLVLSLLPGRALAGGTLNHVGLRLPDAETLIKVQTRLEAAGVRTRREDGVQCCDSTQTKFWVTDPDRTLWEIYLLHEGDEDAEHHSAQESERPKAFANDSTQTARYTWQHNLADGPIANVPHGDNSLHEILLEGSANLHPERFNLAQLLKDSWRALRPGGELRIHGLTADSALKNAFPALPGPAAAVQYVPAHSEVAHALQRAGFVGIFFEQLSEKAHFTGDGVAMRELMVVGRKPGHRPQAKAQRAIYLGPLASVTDDVGNVFPRATPVALNIHDWQALSKHSVANFLLLRGEVK